MKPSRDDLTFWQSCIVTRGAPRWARTIATAKHTPHVAEHLDRAINTRAGFKRDIGASTWAGALGLLALVRSNQSHGCRREPDGSPSPQTLAGYMLQQLASRGSGCNERRPYYRRILARMPRAVVAAGIRDLQHGRQS